jgi:hypothetical protein
MRDKDTGQARQGKHDTNSQQHRGAVTIRKTRFGYLDVGRGAVDRSGKSLLGEVSLVPEWADGSG